MRLQITGRNFDVGEALRGRIAERVEQVSEKYFSGPISSQVTMSRDGADFRADILVRIGTGMDINAEGRAGDAHSAVDIGLEKLEKRLRRYKRRLRDHHAQRTEPAPRFDAPSYVIQSADEEEAEAADLNPIIVAETTMPIQELTVGEAVMQLDLSERPFLVFRNGGHGRLNVVFRRDDGNVGWIDPDFLTTNET